MSEVLTKKQDLANREDTLTRMIPFSSQINESVVITEGGDYLSTWRLHGLSFEGLSDEEVYASMDQLNLLVRSLSSGKFAFWVHRIRRYTSDKLGLPEINFFTKDLMEKYYEKIDTEGLMSTELYITVIYRQYPQGQRNALDKIKRNRVEIKKDIEDAIDQLEMVKSQLSASLKKYRPSLLSNYTYQNKTYSEQLEFYGYLINGHWWRIPSKVALLSEYLPVSRVLFGHEIIEFRDTYGSQYAAMLDIKDYPNFSEPGILNTLLNLECEYVETHSFSPLSTLDAQSALKRQRNQMISAQDSSISQIDLIDLALDQVATGDFSLGEYHYCLMVKGNTMDEVKRYRSHAMERLNQSGFLGVHIDLVNAQAYASQFPANWRFRVREAKLSSRNFTGLCSFHNFDIGKRNLNPWGEAVAILKTPSQAPYYFNFHESPVNDDSTDKKVLGNCQIIGKSGGGKTVLALFLMMNLYKYGTQCIFFDKDRGAEIAIRAMNGQYLSLERGRPTGLAPFKMEPTIENKLFWVELVKQCVKTGGNLVTPQEEEHIHQAIEGVAKLPVELRGFEAVMQFLANSDGGTLRLRLNKWLKTEAFGWALDNSEDILNFEVSRPYGFDYTELLDDLDVCPPVMMYLMYRVEQLIDGRKFAFFMDEYWKALTVDYFKDFAKNKQKTIRKQNGLGVYMTQSPSDTLQSDIAKALIEQTATYIFLANPTADYDDYVNGFKLTPSEYNIVKSLGENSRTFLIKQGHQVALAKLDLNGFDDAIKILSGTTDGVERLERLRAKYGDDPQSWMRPFLDDESVVG